MQAKLRAVAFLLVAARASNTGGHISADQQGRKDIDVTEVLIMLLIVFLVVAVVVVSIFAGLRGHGPQCCGLGDCPDCPWARK